MGRKEAHKPACLPAAEEPCVSRSAAKEQMVSLSCARGRNDPYKSRSRPLPRHRRLGTITHYGVTYCKTPDVRC